MKHMFVPGLIWMMDRWTWFIWFKLDRIWGLGRTNGRMTEQFEYFWPAFRHFFFDIDMDWHDHDNFKMVTSSLVTNSKSMILSKIGYTLNSLVNHNLPVFLAVLSVFSISRRAHIPSYPIISHHIIPSCPSYPILFPFVSHIVGEYLPWNILVICKCLASSLSQATRLTRTEAKDDVHEENLQLRRPGYDRGDIVWAMVKTWFDRSPINFNGLMTVTPNGYAYVCILHNPTFWPSRFFEPLEIPLLMG
jgi:hypothetical protein